MCAAPGQCREVQRQRSDQRLALASLHLRDHVTVQGDSTQHLLIKVPQANGAYCGLPNGGKRLRQDLIHHAALLFVQPLFQAFDLEPQLATTVLVHLLVQFLPGFSQFVPHSRCRLCDPLAICAG